jgi:drug/metabolite transporter (DMT)-like permease
MSFDLSRLRRGEWVVAAGSVALLASMLALPWFRESHTTVDGWTGARHFRWLAVVTLVLAAALLFFQATRQAPAVPVTIAVFVAIFGALTSAWLIYRVGIDPPGPRKAGGWIGLAGALAITYGGASSMRRQGISTKDEPAVIPTVDPWAEPHS